jgi:hypothetical protein
MPKGQQRGNKEARKPKQAPKPPAVPMASATLAPARNAVAARPPKK